MTNTPSVYEENFGLLDGQPVKLYTLTNKKGTQIKFTNYGGIISSWTIVDRERKKSNLVLGFDSLEAYLEQPFYMGAIIGRYANLIGQASFNLEGESYHLTNNHHGHHLHGGNVGFDKKVWDAKILMGDDPKVRLTAFSADGEEGYPGNLNVNVTYELNDDNEFIITYECTTDQVTVVNLTNHVYFNLNDSFDQEVTNHHIMINADTYAHNVAGMVTGDILNLRGTPLDFKKSREIGDHITLINGYNHHYILNSGDESPQLAAVLEVPSGKTLEVYTTEPGLQFYTGGSLRGDFHDRTGAIIKKYSGLCLETQKIPNSPKYSHLPTTTLRPHDVYRSMTKYKIKP